MPTDFALEDFDPDTTITELFAPDRECGPVFAFDEVEGEEPRIAGVKVTIRGRWAWTEYQGEYHTFELGLEPPNPRREAAAITRALAADPRR